MKWVATAVLAASSVGLLGSTWNSAQAEGLNGEAPAANPPADARERPRARGMRGGQNGGQNGRWGMPRDAAGEANRIAEDMARDFNKTLTEAQKTQLKAAIDAREAAIKAARDTFASKQAQITGVTEEQMRAKRREMRRGPGGPNGGPNGQRSNNNGAPAPEAPAMNQ